jgi:hypothetical protein
MLKGKLQNSRNKGFCAFLLDDGTWKDLDPDPDPYIQIWIHIRIRTYRSGSRRPKSLRILRNQIQVHNTGLRTSQNNSDFTQKTSCVFVTQSLDDILEPVLSISTSAAQPLLLTPRRQRTWGRTSRNSTPTREAYNLR